ncbi:hypothetical protein IMG5_134330 [Ichthyophthirius multifiliis]|uniref:Uncharacterized protein n=1 Tax=Ichthyophthirius multifiliis TaxID=5932 RepID=G0QWQ6_ICHMU|nr:hypothetical protein IMG5_134330 [Ichthyophthirius multifiliis]EGR30343.1 hypothetical protein IMG5_134330 [Ichthyophthirius multifiliis]|eukprot:XP_004031930.1 hypothetical protein IMG5_134330 [Ichthyophthirius multifiliis]
MTQIYENKDPLIDKRDEKYIQLKSPTYFYEIFKKKNHKSNEIIPNTIIYESSNPSMWFFNSKKPKCTNILSKNSDKVNQFEIAKFFLGINHVDDLRIDNLSTLAEYIRNTKQNTSLVFVRYIDKKQSTLNGFQLIQLFKEGKQSSSISMIQSYVYNISKADDIYYVEYRHDENTMPLGFKFYKKTFSNKKGYVSQNDQVFIDENKELTIKITEFIEKAYKLKIRKFSPKFMLDKSNSIIFMGIKHLYIDLYNYAPYDIENIYEIKELTFNEFYKLSKMAKKNQYKICGTEMKLPRNIHQDYKTYSSTLYSKLRVEKCGGDFCDYEMLEKNTGPLAMRKNILEEYKKHFSVKKEQLENLAVCLPHEISNQLVLKTRKNAQTVINLLRKNKIFRKGNRENEHQINEENLNQELLIKLYPFLNKSSEALNLENLYKNVKICKSCFIIYSLAAKTFEEQNSFQLKFSKNYSSQQKLNDCSQSIQSSQLENTQLMPQSQYQNSFQFQSKFCKMTRPQTSIIKKNIQNLEQDVIIDSSIITAESKTNYKSNRILSNTKKYIEVNRLTLGFLNYDKLKYLYNEPLNQNLQQNSNFQMKQLRKNSVFKYQFIQQIKIKKQINQLLEKPGRQYKRKDVNADQYLLAKITEEKKNLQKKINSDSQMRKILKLQLTTDLNNNKNPVLIQNQSLYYSHTNFQHLRKLPKFKLSSPIQPFFDELDVQHTESLNIQKVCELMNYQSPIIDCSDVQYFVIDNNTAIPYCLLEEKEKNKDKNNEIIIFQQDFFDSFFEYKKIFEFILNKSQNKKILLFNIPGQAYTVFNQEYIYTNSSLIEIIDSLLFKLDNENKISIKKDSLKFIGVGYGGYILQTFLIQACGNLNNIQNLCLFNSFIELDDLLKDTLNKSQEIFENCPPGMNDLSYNYFSVIVNSQPLTEQQLKFKMQINPILNEGRVSIIQGCLGSQFMKDRFQNIPISCFIVHTLKNCVVNINQSDALSLYYKDRNNEFQSLSKKSDKNIKRVTKYINGGHSLLEENLQVLCTSGAGVSHSIWNSIQNQKDEIQQDQNQNQFSQADEKAKSIFNLAISQQVTVKPGACKKCGHRRKRIRKFLRITKKHFGKIERCQKK